MVHAKANRHAQRAGKQADQRKLERVAHGDGALALAQHAQHGAVVQMAGRKAARGQRHGHGAEQRGQQRHQVQELLGPVQRLAHLGPARFKRLHTHAAHGVLLELRVGPLGEGAHLPVVARHGKAVGQAAGRLHQRGGGNVGLVDHHARRKAHEAATTVGLGDDDACDPQRRIAQQQRVAHLEVQRVQQRRVDPGLAFGGDVARGLARRVGSRRHAQAAAQRVAGVHHLQRHELAGAAAGVGRTAHGGKAQRARGLQAQCPGTVDEGLGCGVVAADHGVAAQQLPRVAGQAPLEPVGKKADGGQRRHRQRHGDDQQAQFTRAQVAPERAPAQAKGRVVHRPDLNPEV